MTKTPVFRFAEKLANKLKVDDYILLRKGKKDGLITVLKKYGYTPEPDEVTESNWSQITETIINNAE
jgi:hypothetical protein